MSVIKKFLIWTSNSCALWTFLLFYVTVLGHSKTAGTTMFGTPVTPVYGLELAGCVIGFIVLSYFFSKIQTYHDKTLDGFWGLITPLIWTAVTCGLGMLAMYGVGVLTEP